MGIYYNATLFYGRLVDVNDIDKKPDEKEMFRVHNEVNLNENMEREPILKKFYYNFAVSLGENCAMNIEGIPFTKEDDKLFHQLDFNKTIVGGCIRPDDFENVIALINAPNYTTGYLWYVSVGSWDTYGNFPASDTKPKPPTYLYNVVNVTFNDSDKQTYENKQKIKQRQHVTNYVRRNCGITSSGQEFIDELEELKTKIDTLIAIEKELEK